LRDVKLAREQVGGDRVAMPTVGRHGMPLPGPAHCYAGLVQHPASLVPPYGKAVRLQLLGHPATPIALPRLGMNRFHTRPQGHFVTIDLRDSLPLSIGVKSAATHCQHITHYCDGPLLLVLRYKGIL
jgi:hypothetical protein